MRIPTVQSRVRIEFSDGSVLDASLFLSATARVQDVLNDERLFIPVSTGDHVELIHKAHIRRITPLKE